MSHRLFARHIVALLLLLSPACIGDSTTRTFDEDDTGQPGEDMALDLSGDEDSGLLDDLDASQPGVDMPRDTGEMPEDMAPSDASMDMRMDSGQDAGDQDTGGQDMGEDLDAGARDDGAQDAGEDLDAGVDMMVAPDLGPSVGNCTPELNADGSVKICVDFPTGVRDYTVRYVEDSFGVADVPSGVVLGDNGYTPRPGECSKETHDRYWVKAQNAQYYRTWHPPETIDVVTGQPCTFGHEHGDDPRESPLYQWAGGVPFGLVNDAAGFAGMHRHEDHFGHKVVVQNKYELAIGNPPGPGPPKEPFEAIGARCYWLSKVHQGTHSGDAFVHNMHEYQNSVMCDDGAYRNPDANFQTNTGPTHHTENSVKTLTFWGQPGWFKACKGLDRVDTADPATSGVEPPSSSDTNREIKCARDDEGWNYNDFPVETVSADGHVDFEPFNGGIEELWKPWMLVTLRNGEKIFNSSAYYGVLNPVRLYNDGSFVPRRDVDGDGTVDIWIPTIEFCHALAASGRNFGACTMLPAKPANVAFEDWWLDPSSPYNGSIRFIHPKRIDLYNRTTRSTFCTDHLGQETADDPALGADGFPTCPPGQIFQRVATTDNLWYGNTSWGPGMQRGDISGSTINARSATLGSGIRHEWVRFFNTPGIHAPN